jgi:glycolate oxidase
MNQILDFDTDNATITVGPGVVLKEIHDRVEYKGLFYPPDPASLAMCTIGGNVAENAGGPRALKYGVTRDYVIGLKGVWANGEPFCYGGKIKKNVAGYDLIGLLVGSEGTLGMITEITLKLIPKPPVVMAAISSFKTSQAAIDALIRVMRSGIHPSTAEFMVAACVEASLNYMNESSKFKRNNAYIIWQLDGISKDHVFEQLMQVQSMAQSDGWTPMDTPEMSEHVWSVRRNVSLGLKQLAGKKYSEDIVVPMAMVPTVIHELSKLNHPSGIQVLGYGHLGDGNIHVNILKMTASESEWDQYAGDVIEKVMHLAVRYGGSISGEHGIGLTKKKFMPLIFSTHDVAIMRQMKAMVDPHQLLNTGKIFNP